MGERARTVPQRLDEFEQRAVLARRRGGTLLYRYSAAFLAEHDIDLAGNPYTAYAWWYVADFWQELLLLQPIPAVLASFPLDDEEWARWIGQDATVGEEWTVYARIDPIPGGSPCPRRRMIWRRRAAAGWRCG